MLMLGQYTMYTSNVELKNKLHVQIQIRETRVKILI